MSLTLGACCSSWRATSHTRWRWFSTTPRQCYSDGPPTASRGHIPLDPLVADLLRTSSPTPIRRKRRKASESEEDPTVDMSKLELPPDAEWRQVFAANMEAHHRVSVRNPMTAAKLAEAFVPTGSKGKVVIEAYPGPGQLTRALLDLPKSRIRKLIVMEDHGPYLDYLRPLEAMDSRVKVLPISGQGWDSYQTIYDLGLLQDVPKVPWKDGIHPELQFISHLPSTVFGEQLINQLLRTIPDEGWLFQYGRLPLGVVMSEYVWERINAPIGDPNRRCKLSVIAEAVSEFSEALPHSKLQPYDAHFHPYRGKGKPAEGRPAKSSSRRVGNPFVAINFIPKEFPAISKGQLDGWDYCLRHLFVRKATPLKIALPGLAPGAQTLLRKITDPNLPPEEQVDAKKIIRCLNIDDWSRVLKAFHEWPFAPKDLSVSDTFKHEDLH